MTEIKLPATSTKAIFVRRENRFVATIQLNHQQYKAHVPSSGRMAELLVPGADLLVTPSLPGRKTDYKLLLAKHGGQWVSVDSLLPNRLIKGALKNRQLTELADYDNIKSEHTFGHSRFDFFLQQEGRRDCFVEVKSVTLVKQGLALFPDAPSERGTKHLHHLTEAIQQGYRSVVMFVVQRSDAVKFRANSNKDKKFADALALAMAKGVEVYARQCKVSPGAVVLRDRLPLATSKGGARHTPAEDSFDKIELEDGQ